MITISNAIPHCIARCLANPGTRVSIPTRVLNRPIADIKAEAAKHGVSVTQKGENIELQKHP